jgi:hypothetical protein
LQQDFNGVQRPSNVVNAIIGQDGLFEVTIYPNPSEGIVNLYYTVSEPSAELTLEVFDATGRIIYQRRDANVGVQGQLVYDLTSVTDGVYNIRVTSAGEERTFRFVKLR